MEDFLPIGSVVLLKGAAKKVMIIGRLQTHAETEKLYDYSACLYPEGYLGSERLYLFNNEDIEMLYYVGMQDEDEFKFRQYMKDKMGEQKKTDETS